MALSLQFRPSLLLFLFQARLQLLFEHLIEIGGEFRRAKAAFDADGDDGVLELSQLFGQLSPGDGVKMHRQAFIDQVDVAAAFDVQLRRIECQIVGGDQARI